MKVKNIIISCIVGMILIVMLIDGPLPYTIKESSLIKENEKRIERDYSEYREYKLLGSKKINNSALFVYQAGNEYFIMDYARSVFFNLYKFQYNVYYEIHLDREDYNNISRNSRYTNEYFIHKNGDKVEIKVVKEDNQNFPITIIISGIVALVSLLVGLNLEKIKLLILKIYELPEKKKYIGITIFYLLSAALAPFSLSIADMPEPQIYIGMFISLFFYPIIIPVLFVLPTLIKNKKYLLYLLLIPMLPAIFLTGIWTLFGGATIPFLFVGIVIAISVFIFMKRVKNQI